MKKDFESMRGKEFTTEMNKLGYPITVEGSFPEALYGMFVAMAQEIEGLRERIATLELTK